MPPWVEVLGGVQLALPCVSHMAKPGPPILLRVPLYAFLGGIQRPNIFLYPPPLLLSVLEHSMHYLCLGVLFGSTKYL